MRVTEALQLVWVLVPVGDEQALLVKARKLLQAPTPVAAFEGYRVADMQQATLALYAELVDG